MPLSPGSLVGPYQVSLLVGVGAMGEIYRARDSRLKRDVALKILRGEMAADPDRLARFQSEAEALAALNPQATGSGSSPKVVATSRDGAAMEGSFTTSRSTAK